MRYRINNYFFYCLLLCGLITCSAPVEEPKQDHEKEETLGNQEPYLIVLGTVQDAGSPQLNCKKDCCANLIEHPDTTRRVVSLGLVDPGTNSKYLFEASPDMVSQLSDLSSELAQSTTDIPDAIFITHGHIGHYTGLMYLGRESVNSNKVPVYLMPRMRKFIESNGPWSQLVELQNIIPQNLDTIRSIDLGAIKVECFLVPHRDEFSETVGFRITGPQKSAIFIPDIDKWNKWDTDIIKLIAEVDYAFLDATFYDAEEIGYRDISEIPHPFVIESMDLFDKLDAKQKNKIHFIHLNHTNPLLNPHSEQYNTVISKGYNISSYLDRVQL